MAASIIKNGLTSIDRYRMAWKIALAFCAPRLWLRLLAPVLVAAGLFAPAMKAYAGPYGATECAASRFGSNLGCKANDVSINNIAVAGMPPSSCVGGQSLPIDLDVTVQFGSSTRYNIGIFVGSDGKSPQLLSASGGAANCSVAALPTASPFFGSIASGGDGNSCGDGDGSINGNTGQGTFLMTGVVVPCTTNGSGLTTLYVPWLISWDQGSGTPTSCLDNTFVVPGTTSKCNTGTVTFPPGTNIVVLPAISVTDGVLSAKSGDSLTYTVVITNMTASTLSGAVFTDPAIASLGVSSVSCAAAGGATCPASPTVAAMQGAGITLPSMPNNSSLTFTIKGTVGAVSSPGTLTNTALVSVSGQQNPASDTDTLLVLLTVGKSFSPNVIASGGTSTLTITLTNPNTLPITGVGFTDKYPSNMQNTGTPGVVSTCTGGTVTGAAGGEQLSLSGATVPAGSSCTVSINVWATAAGTNSTGTVSTTNAGNSSGASATLFMLGSVSNFNAFETSTTPKPGAISGSIYTKLAGSAFSLDVVAISGGSQATGFGGNVKVELLANSGTAGSGYGANNCPTSSSVIQTIASAAIANGRSTVNFAAVAAAYRDVRVRISYPTASPTTTVCSNDSFAIRPSAVTLITSASAAAPSNTATPVVAAGALFNLYAATSTGTNYNGTLSLDSTKLTAQTTSQATTQQSGGAVGTLLPTSLTGNAVTSSNASYTEVGYLYLAAGAYRDDTFTSVDQPNDCILGSTGDSISSGRYGCSIGNNTTVSLGRFIPDHFDTVVTGPMTCPSGLTCPAGGLVYSGQAYITQVTAKNAICPTVICGTTQNYAGSYARAVALSAWDAAGGSNANPGGGTLSSNNVLATAFGAGVAATNTPVYTFPTTPVAPTDIYMRAVDTDGVTSLRGVSSVEGGVKVVSGRIKLSNAYGSELQPLTLTASAQYYTASGWLNSITDSVTNLALLPSYPVASGTTTVTLTPSSGNLSGGKLNIRLGKPSAGAGVAAINPAAPAYLPVTPGKATFGIYKGSNNIIYLRENY